MIEARVNLGPLARVLVALRTPDLRPVWREARKPIRRDIADHRAKQEGPDGAWAPRAAATKLRSRSGRRARRMLGRLPSANRTTTDPRRLVIRSMVAWSEAQRTGATVGHGARIPGRDWMYVSDPVLGQIGVMITDRLLTIFGGGR